MTPAQLTTLIRFQTKTTSVTFTDAEILSLVNIFKDEIAGEIQQARPDIFNTPALDDLVADQREYSIPADILNRIVNLEIKFSSTGEYVTATPTKRLKFKGPLSEDEITAVFTNTNPEYFIRRGAIYILSGTITSVTDGIRLVYDAYPSDVSSLASTTDLSVDPSTTTHGLPKPFHASLARRVTIEYKNTYEEKLGPADLSYASDLRKAIDNYTPEILDEELTASLPSGSSRGDNGYNL